MEIKLKLIIIGPPGCGKTSIIRKYIHNTYSEFYRSTIGVDFALKKLIYNNNIIHIQLWDLAGQERFGLYTKIYYKNSNGAIIVYDLADKSSFDKVPLWLEDIQSKIYPGDNIPILLMGNKLDQLNPDPNNNKLEYSKLNKFIGFKMVSAKTGENLDGAMDLIINHMLENYSTRINKLENIIKLEPPNKPPEKPCCD